MTRSLRRHHLRRLKAKRGPWMWGRDLRSNPRLLGKAVNTPHPMQCVCRSNQRRLEGPTRRERETARDMAQYREDAA